MYVKRRLKAQSPRLKAKRPTPKQIRPVGKDKPSIKPNKPIDKPTQVVEQSMPSEPIKPMSKGPVANKPKHRWANLPINRDWIVAETDTSYFVEMPDGTRLEKYGFWHPKRLFNGPVLSFHDGFTFKLMKYAEKKDGETGPLPVLDVFMIGPNELLAAFGRLGGE